MNGYRGAAVVLDAASGDVLAAVSLPTIDPNALDSTWESLISDPRDPLFNRAFQAGYQPGGALQTMLMTAALISNQPIDAVLDAADAPANVNGLTLTCAETPPASRLTLGEAYAYGCPSPFAGLYDTIGAERFQTLYDLFALKSPPQVDGFPLNARVTVDSTFTLEDALGQGETTVTVAQMAAIAAAVVNGGNAPQPNLLHAVRAPESETWQVVREVRESIPITTKEVSQRVQNLMREATIYGSARRAARSEIAIGGHASLARAGETTLSWFIGFALTGAQDGIAIALVLEDTDDPTLAAEIGGAVLEAAYQQSIGLDDAD
jgi:peptidoglycan glycosyltransferase